MTNQAAQQKKQPRWNKWREVNPRRNDVPLLPRANEKAALYNDESAGRIPPLPEWERDSYFNDETAEHPASIEVDLREITWRMVLRRGCTPYVRRGSLLTGPRVLRADIQASEIARFDWRWRRPDRKDPADVAEIEALLKGAKK